MRLGILTRSLPPDICGIGDHTQRLAQALVALGHDVVLFAGRGAAADGVQILGDDWCASALQILQRRLTSMGLDHLIVQYTPLMFTEGDLRLDRALIAFWRDLVQRMPTSLIVHETYFRTWRHSPSLIRGSWQKHVLKAMVRAAGQVFSASEPLLREMASWGISRAPVLLPIGSNTDVVAADHVALRRRYSLADDDIVLTLFGGSNNLRFMPRHFGALEVELRRNGTPYVWLLLGGVPVDVVSPSTRTISPGWLPSEGISAHLQMSDILVMPHFEGISSKRGTLVTAMAHRLPVIGTSGVMTDQIWKKLPGVVLLNEGAVEDFAARVVALCRDPRRRRTMGQENATHFRASMTWPIIAEKLSRAIEQEL